MNKKSPLKVGSKVSAGAVIGQVGSTGRSTGPHLHLETWVNGKRANPINYLNNLQKLASSASKKTTSTAKSTSSANNIFKGTALKAVPNASIRSFITNASSRYKVKPQLIAAIMKQESGFRTNVRSSAGAYGLMQLMPHFGNGRTNPATNVMLGTQYIAQQLKAFGDVRFALAAYNAGPGRVSGLIKKYGKNWSKIQPHLPKETRNYVTKVLGYL